MTLLCRRHWRRLRPWRRRGCANKNPELAVATGCCRAALGRAGRPSPHELVRIDRQGLVWFLDEHTGVLGALIHDHLNYNASAAKTFGIRRPVDFVRLDQAPLAAGSPVAIEVRVSVLRIFLLMLA